MDRDEPLPDPSLPLEQWEGMAQAIAKDTRKGEDFILGNDRRTNKMIARRIRWLREQS